MLLLRQDNFNMTVIGRVFESGRLTFKSDYIDQGL